MLTDTKIRTLKPRETTYRVADTNGLCIEVRPSGANAWRYRYRHAGKPSIITMAEYPAMGLAEARAEIARLRKKLANRGLAFATLPDLFDPHDWIMDEEGAVLGHVLTVTDLVLDSHWEGVTTLSLFDALRVPWNDDEERAEFVAAYLDVLSSDRAEVEQIHRAFSERNALRRAVSHEGHTA